MQPCDYARIVRDHEAAFVANDNHYADHDDGVTEWIYATRRGLVRAGVFYGVALAAAMVLAGLAGLGL